MCPYSCATCQQSTPCYCEPLQLGWHCLHHKAGFPPAVLDGFCYHAPSCSCYHLNSSMHADVHWPRVFVPDIEWNMPEHPFPIVSFCARTVFSFSAFILCMNISMAIHAFGRKADYVPDGAWLPLLLVTRWGQHGKQWVQWANYWRESWWSRHGYEKVNAGTRHLIAKEM